MLQLVCRCRGYNLHRSGGGVVRDTRDDKCVCYLQLQALDGGACLHAQQAEQLVAIDRMDGKNLIQAAGGVLGAS